MDETNGQVGSPSPAQPGPRLSKHGLRIGRPPKKRHKPMGGPKPPSVPHPPDVPVDRLGRSMVKKIANKEAYRREHPQMVTIQLQMRHTFNGKFYGPGQVTVTRNKADVFLNTEHEAAQKEMSLMRQEAFIIGHGSHGMVKRQVPWAQFDAILGREELPMNTLPREERR